MFVQKLVSYHIPTLNHNAACFSDMKHSKEDTERAGLLQLLPFSKVEDFPCKITCILGSAFQLFQHTYPEPEDPQHEDGMSKFYKNASIQKYIIDLVFICLISNCNFLIET